jgi:solute carrier family 38 (sodium-coupled neutral amino acid transporter), member 11
VRHHTLLLVPMPSLDQSDADSAVYHDCVEALNEPVVVVVESLSSMPGDIAPDNNSAANDVESCPCNNFSDGTNTTIRSTTATSHAPSIEGGSSLPDAVFNFTNSIVGAGCIGLGSAIALSGGFISVFMVIFFAILTKLSLDLLIRLSLDPSLTASTPFSSHNHEKLSYEDMAQLVMGRAGRMVVMLCKFSYSFGCLVAYVIVIKDNCGSALKSLIYGSHRGETHVDDFPSHLNNFLYNLVSQNVWFTWIISSTTILPLCMLRDMTPLAFSSLVSVACMIMIVAIVIYIYFDCPDVRQGGGTFYENWIEIRPGILGNLGTFVFTFVSQHTVHMVFASLKPRLQTIKNWKIVSSCSLLCSATVSLLVGLFTSHFGKTPGATFFRFTQKVG